MPAPIRTPGVHEDIVQQKRQIGQKIGNYEEKTPGRELQLPARRPCATPSASPAVLTVRWS